MKFLLDLFCLNLVLLLSACSTDTPSPDGVESDMTAKWFKDSSDCLSYDNVSIIKTFYQGDYVHFKADHSVIIFNPAPLPAEIQTQVHQWQLLPNDSVFVIAGVDYRTGMNFSDSFVIKTLNSSRFVYKQLNEHQLPLPYICRFSELSLSR